MRNPAVVPCIGHTPQNGSASADLRGKDIILIANLHSNGSSLSTTVRNNRDNPRGSYDFLWKLQSLIDIDVNVLPWEFTIRSPVWCDDSTDFGRSCGLE